MLRSFDTARTLGPYDEYPVLTVGVDPQLHMSRNDRRQPFFLICEKDCLLIQLSGEAVIRFRGSSVNYFRAVPGDHIYVPARTAHRIEPDGVAIHCRYKAEIAGLEAAAWYCDECDAELLCKTWDTAVVLPQEGYLAAVQSFNEAESLRCCSRCGTQHVAIDLTAFRWPQIAKELRDAEKSKQS